MHESYISCELDRLLGKRLTKKTTDTSRMYPSIILFKNRFATFFLLFRSRICLYVVHKKHLPPCISVFFEGRVIRGENREERGKKKKRYNRKLHARGCSFSLFLACLFVCLCVCVCACLLVSLSQANKNNTPKPISTMHNIISKKVRTQAKEIVPALRKKLIPCLDVNLQLSATNNSSWLFRRYCPCSSLSYKCSPVFFFLSC